MASVLAIVSKAVFEKLVPKSPAKVGDRIARARRRDELFPEAFLALADQSNIVGYGFQIHACPAFRELVERLTPAQRIAFDQEQGQGFFARSITDRSKGREIQVPVLVGTWWYADLLPPEPTAAAMIEAIVAWKGDKRPREQVLDVIAAVGPACLPHIDRALALRTKPAHHALLVAARKRLGPSRALIR